MEPTVEGIKPNEAPIFLEFIWMSTLTLLLKIMTDKEIGQIAEISSERCRGFGMDEEGIESFNAVISKIINYSPVGEKVN